MTKALKILTSISSVFLCGAIASGIILAVKEKKNANGEREAIQLTLLNSAISTDSDLGKLKPGESKKQTFELTSLIDMRVTVFVEFSSKEKSDAYDYVKVSIASDSSKKDAMLSEFISGKEDMHIHLGRKEKKDVSITYQLSDEFPENIIGQNLNFSITFDANSGF